MKQTILRSTAGIYVTSVISHTYSFHKNKIYGDKQVYNFTIRYKQKVYNAYNKALLQLTHLMIFSRQHEIMACSAILTLN